MKKIVLVALVTFPALGVFSQSVENKVEKQVKDPQRTTQSGKADVYAAPGKPIFDSTTFKNSNTQQETSTAVKPRTKKSGCAKSKHKTNKPATLKK